MSEFKSHKVLVKNIPDGKPICSVGNKSLAGLIVGWIFIVGIIFYYRSFLIAIPLMIYELILVFKPYKSIFDGYNSYFVIFNKDNKNECNLYYLSEIRQWAQSGNYLHPSVIFYLNDGSKVVLERAIDSEIFKYLRKVAAKKEIVEKR